MRALVNVNFGTFSVEGGRGEKGDGASTVYSALEAYVSSQLPRI
jgi:hypothetical protein